MTLAKTTNSDDPQLTEILRRLANSRSDEEAWRLLYERMWPFVLGISYRYLRGHQQLAEDASQEVFVRLLLYCPFEDVREPPTFKAYLYSVCRNVARDYVTRIIKQSETLPLEMFEDWLPPERDTASPEEIVLLRRRLQSISDELEGVDREIVLLMTEGYTHAEIARRSGLTEANVSVRLHRLRQRLAKHIK